MHQPASQSSGVGGHPAQPATPLWSVRMADSMLARRPVSAMRWRYEDGFLLRAFEQAGLREHCPRFSRAVADYVDRFVTPEGGIESYRLADYNLDQVMPGRLLISAYRTAAQERHRRAILLLVEQLRRQPRTEAGGFWHKLIYPHQMWLDGLYMGSAFYTEYGGTFHDPAAFDDVAHQVGTIRQRMTDPATGLLYHAWDERRLQLWADPVTGCSPHFWCRGMGWYVMALVDILECLPATHGARGAIRDGLAAALEALLAVRDPHTGLWWQVLDQGERAGNYLEASGSLMFIYALAKGVRIGCLPAPWVGVAVQSFGQAVAHFVRVDANGETHLHGTCGVAGLGGDPYRDGSYDYYVGEPTVTDEPKGVAAFILAALEVEAIGPAAREEGS